MHEKLYSIIKDNLGSEFVKPSSSIYNIFPNHIPDGAIDNAFTSALVYNFIGTQIDTKLNMHSIQLTVFNKSFSESRRIGGLVKDLFNNKVFAGDGTNLISSIVTGYAGLEYDTDTGIYAVAVTIAVKTTLN